MTAREEIDAERARQIVDEGWSEKHDDGHVNGELMRAGMVYLHWGTRLSPSVYMATGVPMGWPWSAEWWKPKDRRRNLVRAGALFLAERSRLLRASPNAYVGHVDHKLNLAVGYIEALS